MDDYAPYFDNIDPLAHHKKWTIGHDANETKTVTEIASRIYSQRVQTAFIVSDSVDRSRDILVALCFSNFM